MKHAARGSSLIEVLIAGAMMAVGLSGVLLLLLRGAEENRDATWTVNASNASMTMLEEVSAGSIANIDTLPTSSVYTDPSTGRSFVRRISVTNLGDAGPSGGVSARRVAISVEWSSHALSGGGSVMSDGGTGHVETLTAIVSEVNDGGT